MILFLPKSRIEVVFMCVFMSLCVCLCARVDVRAFYNICLQKENISDEKDIETYRML